MDIARSGISTPLDLLLILMLMLPAGVTVRCRIRLARKAAFMRGHGRGFSREMPALARRKPAKAGSEWRSRQQALPLPDVCAAAKPFE